jgi:hypothetical protein
MYIPNVGAIPDEVIADMKEILKEENSNGNNFVRAIKHVRECCQLSLAEAKIVAEDVLRSLQIEHIENEAQIIAIFLCGIDVVKNCLPNFPYVSKFEIKEISPGKMTRVCGKVSEVMKVISSMAANNHYDLYKVETL